MNHAPRPGSRARAPFIGIVTALACVGAALVAGCGTTSAPNPFKPDAGVEGAGGSGVGGGAEGGSGGEGGAGGGGEKDPTLGGPCVDDGQCNDGKMCTFDVCDQTVSRCRFTPDDASCQNGFFCDGVETCDPKLDCVAGVPIGCDDLTPCTIDSCDEATGTCVHGPRDADEDGDTDVHCPTGGDCDDADASVSSTTAEVCANQKDDNCDGVIDEATCTTPEHDTCLDPLEVSASGAYAMSTMAAKFDYATSCGLGNQPGSADVVAAIVLPAGALVDVEITARTNGIPVSAAIAGQCGDPASEIACGSYYPAAQGGMIAKILARSVGDAAQPIALPVYVATQSPTAITLEVQLLPASMKPTNETCGTAQPVTAGVPFLAAMIDAKIDVASGCYSPIGDLLYTFSLAATADVDVYATSLDGDGTPSISLRGAGCALISDELACANTTNPHVFKHSLPAGTYYVAVSASAPTRIVATVEVSAPTPLPADELCAGAPQLVPNKTIDVPLAGHQDDVSTCFPGVVDAAYALTLPVASDVLLVERIANADLGVVSLVKPTCFGYSDVVTCSAGSPSPVRSSKRNVPAGEYRVIVESVQAGATELTAFVRPAVPPTLVPFADGCGDVVTIPPGGGFFQGTTANALADYAAGCDQGGVPAGGAPEQLLTLTLAAQKRVVFDMSGSGFTTVLDVRKGPACPGFEMAGACAVGYYQGRSYLDLLLDPGTYFVQIDGFNLDKGAWFLDVRVVDPT